MAEYNAIHDDDLPAFKQLLRDYRAGRLGTPSAASPKMATVAGSQTRIVVLLEPLETLTHVSAAVLVSTNLFVQDVYLPDRTPPGFTLSNNRGSSTRIPPDITAEELYEQLIAEGILDANELHHIEFGGAVQRWKIVYSTSSPSRTIEFDEQQPRVRITSSTLADTGQRIVAHVTIPAAEYLPPGTLCQAHFLAGKGWTITESELFPAPPSADSEVTYIGDYSGCARQVIPQGDSSECSACLPNDTPQGFIVSQTGLEVRWPEFFEMLTTGDPAQGYVDPTERGIFHNASCNFKSDFFFNDLMYFDLDIFANTTSPPACRLRILGNPAAYEADGLEIVYWCEGPFDALGRNRFTRISHLSRGTADLPRHKAPGCLILHPYAQPCYNVEELRYLQQWNCTVYWTTRIQDTELVAGPREPNLGVTGCIWPAYNPPGAGEMRVEYVVDVGSTTGHVGPTLSWTITASITWGTTDLIYSAQGSGYAAPDCFSVTLINDDPNRPADLPERITITPWQN